MAFKEIAPQEIKDNVFKLIDQDWMLITAGTLSSFNTMTASWGGLGIMWGRPVAACVIRPSRHTFGFVDRAESFSLCFFEEKYKDILNYCGSKSGRDVDKIKETGLKPIQGKIGIYYEQARLVLECRKLYTQDIDPKRFVDKNIERNYNGKDYHRMFLGEIVSCLARV